MDEFKEKLKEAFFGGDYDSEFEYDSKGASKQQHSGDIIEAPEKVHISKPKREKFIEECDKEQTRVHRNQFLSKDVYTRHKELINQYVLCYRGSTSKLTRDRTNDKTDHDVIKENHQFLWDEDEENPDTWEKQLAKKYYDKLFKEYCLADLCRYKENKIAMRWRTETEVIKGKGQFSCGYIRCDNKEELRSWEVNFGYLEHGMKKNALVKIRLCPKCSYKLNYHHKRKEVTKKSHEASLDEPFQKKQKTSNFESPAETEGTSQESEDKTSESDASEIWKTSANTDDIESAKNREDDFEKYLADMLL